MSFVKIFLKKMISLELIKIEKRLTLLGMVAGSLAAVIHKNTLADIKSITPIVIATTYPPF